MTKVGVGYPLYQDRADEIADVLSEMAADIRLYPESFSLNLIPGINGTKYCGLNLESDAGPFLINVQVRGLLADID